MSTISVFSAAPVVRVDLAIHTLANGELPRGLVLVDPLLPATLLNVGALLAWKKAFRAVPNTPGLFWFGLFAQNVERYVETQKGVIDLAVEQTHALADLAYERGSSAAKIVEGVTSMFQQTVQHSVALHKKTLDHYAEQHKTA